MTTGQHMDLLTVREAAELLKVSIITVHRWLKAGRLLAYHVGPKAVRIRRADVEAMLTPIRREELRSRAVPTVHGIEAWSSIRPLTAEEVARGWEAFKASEVSLAGQLARRGGVPFDESWPLIRAARDEREQRR